MPLSNGASREPATPIGKKRKTRSAPKRRRTKAKRAGKGRRKMTAKQAKYFGKRKRRKRRA